MSLGYIIVLEKEIAGVDPREVDGRTLAAQRHALDAMAHEMDLPGLGEFVAFSQTEAETLAEDMKFDAPVGGHTGRWYDCAKGLEVVRAVKSYIEEDPDETVSLNDPKSILDGLSQMQSVLEAGETEGTRFRLSIDY